jgi:hypothetical protein
MVPSLDNGRDVEFSCSSFNNVTTPPRRHMEPQLFPSSASAASMLVQRYLENSGSGEAAKQGELSLLMPFSLNLATKDLSR